jgi:hypothetical protein
MASSAARVLAKICCRLELFHRHLLQDLRGLAGIAWW